MTAPTPILRAVTPFAPASVDEKARTVELVASTGAGVQRFDQDGLFTEVLEVTAKAVDLKRASGLPLLDSHRQDDLGRVLGVVRAIAFRDGALIATVEFSARAEPIWQDVKAGIIRNVSIGYRPVKWRDSVAADGTRTRTITRWELLEVSLVPVGADPSATVRSTEMTTATITDPPAAVPAPVVTRAAANAEIRALATTFDLPRSWADDLIDRNASEGDARAAALEALRSRVAAPPVPRLVIGQTLDPSPETFVRNAGEAVYATRANPRHQLSEQARPLANLTTLDLARHALNLRGLSTLGSPADVIGRALHTTSDFPAIFGDTANRVLRTAYAAAPATLKAVARQTTARDFRAKTSVQLGEAPTLEQVNEHGEYRYGTMAEAKETYKIGTYGKIIGLSRQAIINDDLGAFTDLAGKFGLASAEFEAQFLVDLLVKNSGSGPTMDDGIALFHANHGNLAGSGAALSADALSAARLAMRRQKGLAGRAISVAPKFLLVPPEQETKAEQVLAAISPATTATVNPFAGKLDLLVEARFASLTRWYVAADPATVEGLEYAYLSGAEGPQTETRAGFEVDGLEVKVRLDFGAAFLDWRGWYANAGA